MSEALNVNQANQGDTSGDAKHRQRRQKSGNSDLFNDLLSAANGLSVAERTRLVKSLAGQLGLLTVGGQSLIDKPDSSGKAMKGDKAGTAEAAPPVRPNPLKGTKFWVDKEAARAAMLKAREDAGGAQLPPNHPAVTAYASALKAYKDEQAQLKPVTGVAQQQQAQGGAAAKQRPTKRRADKSPVRGGGLVAGAMSIAKRYSSSAKQVTDVTMKS